MTSSATKTNNDDDKKTIQTTIKTGIAAPTTPVRRRRRIVQKVTVNGKNVVNQQSKAANIERDLIQSSRRRRRRGNNHHREQRLSDGGGGSKGASPDVDEIGIFRSLPLRVVVFEVPILLCLVVVVLLHVANYCHSQYLHPYIEAIRWTEHRKRTEQTYPSFQCNETAITTRNPSDLFIPRTSAVGDAVDSVMLHGGGVFPDLIERNDATELREYLIQRAFREQEKDLLPIIAAMNRRSFALTGNDHPLIAKVLKSVASNQLLHDSLEELLGPNPAILALSTIIAFQGAEDQDFHLDKPHEGSSMQYGRTFAPNYALLIPLQDTTPDMGATSICPGTHRCHDMNRTLCEINGFHVAQRTADDNSRLWKAGDGLIYNGQVRHRGSANKSGPTRVVFILTFGTKPDGKRMLPMRSLFALRQEMWGFCLDDMFDAAKYMKSPHWRALGLFKHEDAEWGWDFVRLTLHRIANDAFLGSIFEELEARGHAWWINILAAGMSSSLPDSEEEQQLWAPYEDFAIGLLWRLEITLMIGLVLWTGGYYLWLNRSFQKSQVQWTMVRIEVAAVLCAVLALWFVRTRIDTSYWQAVASKRAMTGERINLSTPCDFSRRVVNKPDFHDVLFGMTLQDDHEIGAMSKFFDYHHGNQLWKSVAISSLTKHDKGKESSAALVRIVVQQTKRIHQSRFLHECKAGQQQQWHEMTDEEAINITTKLLDKLQQ